MHSTVYVLSVGVIDFEKLAVDGGMRFNSVEGKMWLRDDYLRACRAIPKNSRAIVQTVILQNRMLDVKKNDLPVIKAMLCAALDALAIFYMRETSHAK